MAKRQKEKKKKQKKKKKSNFASSCHGSVVRTHLVSMRTWVQSLVSFSGLRIWHCHELWCWSQVPAGSHVFYDYSIGWQLQLQLAWEHPYAMGVAQKDQKKKKEKKVLSMFHCKIQHLAQSLVITLTKLRKFRLLPAKTFYLFIVFKVRNVCLIYGIQGDFFLLL